VESAKNALVGHKMKYVHVLNCLYGMHVVLLPPNVIFILTKRIEDFIGKTNNPMLLWWFLRELFVFVFA